MKILDETLMAFADGELDAATRAAVEAAMRENPEMQRRVAQHLAVRERIEKAYALELSEPIPERLLIAAGRAPQSAAENIVDLKSARESRVGKGMQPRRAWWQPAGAIAASVIIGFGLGYGGRRQAASTLSQGAGGAVVASGDLAQALSRQLTAEQSPTAAVKIGVSFLAKSGDYCRTFSLSGAAAPAGLACRHDDAWQILALTQVQGSLASDAGFRTASSSISPAILQAVEEQIAGVPLDAAAESAARSAQWTAPR